MANPPVRPPIFPGDGTVLLLTTETPPRTFVFPLVGAPPDPTAALVAGFKSIADAIAAQAASASSDSAAQTAAMVNDDQKFLALQPSKPATPAAA